VNQYELEGLWVKGSLPGVEYRFDDAVLIKHGEHGNKVARVVALICIEPTPVYVVEFQAGNSAVLEQSDLERAV
jgi:hypothetical protein